MTMGYIGPRKKPTRGVCEHELIAVVRGRLAYEGEANSIRDEIRDCPNQDFKHDREDGTEVMSAEGTCSG